MLYHEYGRYTKLVEEIEEKCLKKSRHFPAKEAIYETPSDYDPLALNMGQLVVHRISLRSVNQPINILVIVVLVVVVFLIVKCWAGASVRRANCNTGSAVARFCLSNIRSQDTI